MMRQYLRWYYGISPSGNECRFRATMMRIVVVAYADVRRREDVLPLKIYIRACLHHIGNDRISKIAGTINNPTIHNATHYRRAGDWAE